MNVISLKFKTGAGDWHLKKNKKETTVTGKDFA